MKFKPGDLVWADCKNNTYHMHGRKAGVVTAYANYGNMQYQVHVEGYNCIETSSGDFYAMECHLEPRRPPAREDMKTVGWDKVVWKPTGVNA